MLLDELNLDVLMELAPSGVADFCEQTLNAESLDQELQEMVPFDRKGLCNYLGVGESTLSGWFKQGRIPRMAKEAFVLLRALGVLVEEVRRLREESNDLKVLKDGDTYRICVFEPDEDGEVVGRIIADRVATLEQARLLSSAMTSLKMLQQTKKAINYVLDMTENESFARDMENLRDRITRQHLFVTKHEQWRELFGARRLEGLLDLETDAKHESAVRRASTGTNRPVS